jgi:hypothetical protein
MGDQSPRWIAKATYRSEQGPMVVEHRIEELGVLQDVMERGPDWNALIEVNVVLNPMRATNPGLTVERAAARTPTTSHGLEGSIARSTRTSSLEDIAEAEATLWIERQLSRIRARLSEYGADDDMLKAVNYLLEENDRWLNPRIADDLRAGRLHSGEA